jgi:pimeloyl-ACP methyl ester carboxylesterase
MIGAASQRDIERGPGRRARVTARAFAIAPLLLLLALVSAARCYPPGTRIVVFMQGIYTSYDAGGPPASYLEPHRFDTLKAAFVAKGYGTAALLDFSYDGGTVDGSGAWVPAAYTCDATDRSPDDNLAPLEAMLTAYRRKHPNVHFTLVGHSLGGYLAFLEGARDAARPDSEKLGVDVIVTLDAPLKGISADKKPIIDLLPCVKTYLAGGDLVAARLNPATPDVRRYQAAVMAQQGVRLATLGNSFDCLYNTSHCIGGSFTDDSATQFLFGQASITKDYRFDTALAFASHDAILTNVDAVRDTVAFIGAP